MMLWRAVGAAVVALVWLFAGFMLGMTHEKAKRPWRGIDMFKVETTCAECRHVELMNAVYECDQQRAEWERKARTEQRSER